MPIVSTGFRLGPAQPDGRVRAYDRYIDHTGEVHERHQWRNSGDDHAALLAAHSSELELLLVKREKQAFISFVENGGMPASFIRKHSTRAGLIKPLVKVFLGMKSAHAAVPIAEWIQENLTAAQLTGATSNNIKNIVLSRMSRLLSMKVNLSEDNAELIEVK